MSVVAVTQEQKPDMDVGRVPELQTPSRAWGIPAKHSQSGKNWDGLGTPGTETTQPGGADGTGKPALGGERRPLYRLHKSDVLDIVFTFSPEFNQTVNVQPDGFIRLRAIGSIYAEGRTLPEVEDLLRQAYSSSLHDPEVTVELKDFDKPYFIAAGEVTRPGKYELRTDTTITEAVAIAGGFSQQARHSQVLLFRRVSDDLAEAKVVDIKKMLNHHTLGDPRPGAAAGAWSRGRKRGPIYYQRALEVRLSLRYQCFRIEPIAGASCQPRIVRRLPGSGAG